MQGIRRQARRLVRLDRRWSARMAQTVQTHRTLYRSSAMLAHVGDGLVWFALGLGVLALGSPSARRFLPQVAVAVGLTALCVTALKYGVRRPRPRGLESAQWSALRQFDLYSFPSGHAARLACIAASLCAVHPAAGIPMALSAIGVSLARVALAAHYLLDVLVGLLVGGLVARLVTLAWPGIVMAAQGVGL